MFASDVCKGGHWFSSQELKSNLNEVESKLEAKLECVQRKLDALLEGLGNKELNEWLKRFQKALQWS